MPTRWMCQSRLECPTQKKTWHTCCFDLPWYHSYPADRSFMGGPRYEIIIHFVFSHLYWAVLYHLTFCLVFVLHSPGIDFNNDTPPGESNKSKRSCSANYSHGLRGDAASMCEQEQALWAEVSWFCWVMWRSAMNTSVGPSSRGIM